MAFGTIGNESFYYPKWCTNTSQPDIETLIKISKLLSVELQKITKQKTYRFCESFNEIINIINNRIIWL